MSKVIQSARMPRVKQSRPRTELKAPIQLDDASFMAPLALYFTLTVSIDHWHVIEFNLMKYFSQYVVALRKFLTMWIFILRPANRNNNKNVLNR